MGLKWDSNGTQMGLKWDSKQHSNETQMGLNTRLKRDSKEDSNGTQMYKNDVLFVTKLLFCISTSEKCKQIHCKQSAKYDLITV